MSRVRVIQDVISCDHCGNVFNTEYTELKDNEMIGGVKTYDYCEDCNNHLMEFSIKCKCKSIKITSDTIGGKKVE